MIGAVLTLAGAMIDLNIELTRIVTDTCLATASTFTEISLAHDSERSIAAGFATAATPAAACSSHTGTRMYTVFKAKEEIDAIARHAMDIAAHALASDERLNAKLDSFKHEILAHIDAKFAELEKAVMGEANPSDSSAVSDLGAKVALLKDGQTETAPHQDNNGDRDEHHHQGDEHQDHG